MSLNLGNFESELARRTVSRDRLMRCASIPFIRKDFYNEDTPLEELVREATKVFTTAGYTEEESKAEVDKIIEIRKSMRFYSGTTVLRDET